MLRKQMAEMERSRRQGGAPATKNEDATQEQLLERYRHVFDACPVPVWWRILPPFIGG